jgi:putative effector of murein hydrolase LrgA (UPF0299 family)
VEIPLPSTATGALLLFLAGCLTVLYLSRIADEDDAEE